MYALMQGDIPQLAEVLHELNFNNCTIITAFYISDSQQFVIIYDEPEGKPTIGFLQPDEE